MRELMRWLDRLNDTQRPARLDRFLDRLGDANTRAVLEALQQDLEEGRRVADRRALSNNLVRARGRWLEQAGQIKANVLALPPLNGAPGKEV